MMLDLKCKGLIDFRDVVDALDNQEEEVKKIDLTSNDIQSVREKTFFFDEVFRTSLKHQSLYVDIEILVFYVSNQHSLTRSHAHHQAVTYFEEFTLSLTRHS